MEVFLKCLNVQFLKITYGQKIALTTINWTIPFNHFYHFYIKFIHSVVQSSPLDNILESKTENIYPSQLAAHLRGNWLLKGVFIIIIRSITRLFSQLAPLKQMTHCQLQFIVIFELFFFQDCTGNLGSLSLHILKYFCT